MRLLLATLFAISFSTHAAGSPADDLQVSPDLLRTAGSDHRVAAFYAQRGWRVAWDRTQALALVDALAGADRHGLRTDAYDIAIPGRSVAERDVALTRQRSPMHTRLPRAQSAAASVKYIRSGRRAWPGRAVVGRNDHPTPSLETSFRRLTVNPPWRVPASIARREILPRGPSYVRREGLVWRDGLLVQPPGPRCALGLVKFDLEDRYEIYLHDTPAKRLFALSNWHRSHGCVRVQHAVALARLLASERGRHGLIRRRPRFQANHRRGAQRVDTRADVLSHCLPRSRGPARLRRRCLRMGRQAGVCPGA